MLVIPLVLLCDLLVQIMHIPSTFIMASEFLIFNLFCSVPISNQGQAV